MEDHNSQCLHSLDDELYFRLWFLRCSLP
jgi:hypothetical protein